MRLNKLAKKIFAAGLAVSLMMANAGVSFAEATPNAYEPVNGTETTFTKFLVMDEGANVPNATFKFTVTPIDNDIISSSADKLTVYKGTGSIPEVTAEFKAGDPKYTTVQAEDKDKIELATGQAYAKVTAKIDMSSATFSRPGVYRYTVKEDTTAIQGINFDTNTERTLDVYVIANDDKLEVKSYVLREKTDAAPGVKEVEKDGVRLGAKSDSYTNEYKTNNLIFKKEVKGNQASRDKYFKFAVKITGAVAGTKYTVDLGKAESNPTTNAATKYETMTNPTEMTAGNDGTVNQDFYLQHGQEIVIKGLTEGTNYEITEDAEDYTSSKLEDYADPTTGTVSKEIKTGYLNTKTGTIPTGVILDSAPFILIIGLAAAALVITAARKKVR